MIEKRNSYKRALGILGEELAAGFLDVQGYKLVERNYRCPYGEIDLIVQKDEALFFVEVKTRTGEKYGSPAEGVNVQKQEKIRRAAVYYLTTRKTF